MRRTRVAALALGLATLAAAAFAVLERPRAAGGVRLLEAAETAPVTVVGHVLEPRRIDQHGHTALLRVEMSLRGPLEPGAELRIAWEERAASRAPRFEEGDRILVSLERLAGASIWHARFPEPAERVKGLFQLVQRHARARQAGPNRRPHRRRIGLHRIQQFRPPRQIRSPETLDRQLRPVDRRAQQVQEVLTRK